MVTTIEEPTAEKVIEKAMRKVAIFGKGAIGKSTTTQNTVAALATYPPPPTPRESLAQTWLLALHEAQTDMAKDFNFRSPPKREIKASLKSGNLTDTVLRFRLRCARTW